MSNQSPPNNNQSSSRWWEYYLARYLLPSITGVFILIYLTEHSAYNQSLNYIKNTTTSSYIVLIICGFAYCYIASFPALVFHAVRKIFFNRNKKSEKCTLKRYPWIWIISSMAFIFVISAFSLLKINDDNIESHYIYIIYALLILSFTAFSVIQIIFLFISKKDQFKYLKKLSNQRAQSKNDMTDSYRHLREHGNTGLIFILEILLSIPCYIILAKNGCYHFEVIITLLIIWSLPGACVYFLGQYFEYRFATDKKEDSLLG